MALALGNKAHKNVIASSTTISLSATAGSAVLIAITTNGGPVTSISSATDGAFTFHGDGAASSTAKIELWYISNISTWTSDTITVNTTTSAYLTIDIFEIQGADTLTVFDGNASVPDEGNSDPGTISTNTADTMIVGVFRMGATPGPTAGSGYTLISGLHYQLAEYQIVSATQSSLSVTIGTGVGDANGRICTAIIQAAAGGATIPAAISETLQLGDALVARTALGASVADVLGLADQTVTGGRILAAVSETIGLADSLAAAAVLSAAVADTVGIADAATVRMALAADLAEAIGVGDTAAGLALLSAALGETVGIGDVIATVGDDVPPPARRIVDLGAGSRLIVLPAGNRTIIN